MGIIELEQKRSGAYLGSPKIYPGIDLQWKVIDDDQGIIRGYLAVFNNVDSAKDRIRPGAFKKTIQEALQRKDNRGKKYLWPLLWMHDPDKPIGGFLDATEDKTGLLVTAQLDISTNAAGIANNALAMSVFSGFKMGYIDELSIGYKAIQKSYDKDGVRDLTEIQNFEGSAVTMNFAANELAQVTSVKSKDKAMPDKPERKDFNDHYRQECIEDWLYGDFNNLTQALRGAIIDMFMIGDSPQADTVSTILNDSAENKIGFISALQAYVQKGIDLDVPNYLTEQQNNNSGYYGYMTRRPDLDAKTGAVVSSANADRMQGHVNTLMQVKDAIHTVAQDITHYITGNEAYVSDAGTTSKTANHTLEPFYRALKNATNNQPLTSTDSDLEQFSNWLQSQISSRDPNDAA